MTTTEVVMALAEESNPGRAIGFTMTRLIVLGLAIWGIVRLVLRWRHKSAGAQNPASQTSAGTIPWQYTQQQSAAAPQPYWDGAAWRYPPQSYPAYPQQTYPHQQWPPQ
ncbi:hypothetical protein [Mycolicibacterium neoaurum]|uniref:hypothetical protein n=1 Tax=Mycolicibacterium neoaurum TaxID=1795 RepID=UPI001F4CADD0|nr:hypothetical protein [Mycolicibacterium neoaurum]